MVATNSVGNSPNGTVLSNIFTSATVPSAPSLNFTKISSTSVLVTLNVTDTGGSQSTYYELQKSVDGTNFTEIYYGVNDYYNVFGLSPSTLYYFRGFARNSIGLSGAGQSQIITAVNGKY